MGSLTQRLFYSYSSADETLRAEFEKHLALLKREGLIETWTFRNIDAGQEWKRAIDENLNSATIILLLISADFMSSDYCWEIEMKRALERHEAGEASVVPIILKSCDWKTAPFAKLQVLPEGGRPITSWRPRDRAWTNVVAGLRRIIQRVQRPESPSVPPLIEEKSTLPKETPDSIAIDRAGSSNRSHSAKTNTSKNDEGSEPPGGQLPALPAVLLSVGILLLFAVLLLWQLPRIHEHGLRAITFVVYLMAAVISGVILFRATESIAEVTGRTVGLQIRAGGAAAIVIIVLLVGLRFETHDLPTFSAKFYFVQPDGEKAKASGRITIRLDAPTSIPINEGYATQPLDIRYQGRTVSFDLELPGYITSEHTALLSDRPIQISVSQGGDTPLSSTELSSLPVPRRVAVLTLRNKSGNSVAWWAAALRERVADRIGADEKVRVISGEEVVRAEADLALKQSDLGPETLARIRNYLNVDLVVSGSYTLAGDGDSSTIGIELELFDTDRGRRIGTFPVANEQMLRLPDLVSDAANAMRQLMGIGELDLAAALAVEAAQPSTDEGKRYYAEGVEMLRRFDAKTASELLERAASVEPRHALIRVELAKAYSALGHELQARKEASEAVALSKRAGRYQKLKIEVLLHRIRREWAAAAEKQQRLHEKFPDDLDYALELADILIRSENLDAVQEAVETVRKMRKLPQPLRSDPRIDCVDAQIHQQLGDSRSQIQLSVAAARRAAVVGARRIAAEAKLIEATAHLNLGEPDKAYKVAEEARSVFSHVGDRRNEARAIEQLAACREGSNPEDERSLFDDALSTYRHAGDEVGVARVLVNIGTLLVDQQRFDLAAKNFDAGLAIFKKYGARYDEAGSLNNIAISHHTVGNIRVAKQYYEDALDIFVDLGDQKNRSITLANIGEVLECMGDLKGAYDNYQDARNRDLTRGDQGGIAYVDARLSGILALRGSIAEAEKGYLEVIPILEKTDPTTAISARITLANIAIYANRAAEAERSGRVIAKGLSPDDIDQRIMAQRVISEALLAQARAKEAAQFVNAFSALTATTKNRQVRFDAEITIARVRASSRQEKDISAALASLEQIRTDASRNFFAVSELEARLASGEIEVATGRGEGRKHLISLEQDARAKGFLRIARRAGAGAVRQAVNHRGMTDGHADGSGKSCAVQWLTARRRPVGGSVDGGTSIGFGTPSAVPLDGSCALT